MACLKVQALGRDSSLELLDTFQNLENWMRDIQFSRYNQRAMIDRPQHLKNIQGLLREFPVVLIVGARQVGKTTLAHQIGKLSDGAVHFFDLESEVDVRRLADAELSLRPLRGLVILDEIQNRPDLFQCLRVLADRPRRPARFLVLGSAAPELLRQSSETLAGRVAHYEVPGISLAEVGSEGLERLWLRGGFPRSLTARSHSASYRWRTEFVRTFVQRDVPQLGISVPASTLDRFWAMLSHCHAQIWNGSELARAFGVSHHSVRRYLEALERTYMVRALRPWHANIKKRQIKSPKVYFRDSGILHRYLSVATFHDLERHPKIGASWEGFVIESVIQALGLEDGECYFWATHAGAEIDLIVQRGSELQGIEVKLSAAPSVTKSMQTALAELGLSRIDVIHAGQHSFPMARQIHAVPATRIHEDL